MLCDSVWLQRTVHCTISLFTCTNFITKIPLVAIYTTYELSTHRLRVGILTFSFCHFYQYCLKTICGSFTVTLAVRMTERTY